MSVTIKTNEAAVMHEIKARARDGLREVGPEILRSAIRKCPVRTGNLQRSIETDYAGLTLRVGSRVHYAGYVEGGTPKMSPRAFLRGALRENLRRIKKVFKAI